MAKRLSTFTWLVVNDLEKMAAFYGQVFELDRVRAAGGVQCDIRNFSDMKARVALATDPEGHLIEIVERSD